MPRAIAPALRACLERANPRVRHVVEVAAPDVGRVLRRAADQLLLAPDPLVSLTPAGALVAASAGEATLAATAQPLVAFGNPTSSYALNREDEGRRLKGLRWTVDPGFGRAVLRTFTAEVVRTFSGSSRFELQVYRAHALPGVIRQNDGSVRDATQWTFTALLSPAPVVMQEQIVWVNDVATLRFDLTNYGLVVESTPQLGADGAGEAPAYYFVLRELDQSKNDRLWWRTTTTSTHWLAGLGGFDRVYWARNTPTDPWTEQVWNDVPICSLEVERYTASAQAVYAIDCGAAPAADSTGRVVFERRVPPGTACALDLSTAGPGGPWAPVKDGDPVLAFGPAQQVYHLRATLAADPAQRAAPGLLALGVEFRRVVDVTEEAVVDPPGAECSAPFLEAAIGEGRLKVLRTGRRDYEDVATELGAAAPATRLEVDVYLASDHPSVTRADWLHLARAGVSNRTPTDTAEEFSLLSYAARLKRKVPRRAETVSAVHRVQAATLRSITVQGGTPLVGTTPTGNEYDGRAYYVRVRQSAAVAVGATGVIAGNTGSAQLDFADDLPGVLAAGDLIEVHSAVFTAQPLEYRDMDPAAVWWDLLAVQGAVPPERIGRAGLGSVGRAGLPPRVTEICPGDAAAQARRKVTMKVAEEVGLDELVDQVSFLMGGVTLDVGGQLCFVQIYPLRDGAGRVTVAPPALAAIVDPRDYTDLATPPGLEARATVVACDYGVDAAAANPDAMPKSTTTWADVDAVAWLAQQDLEVRGSGTIPEEVSRWFYNSADGGLTLASECARMVCLAAATGLRVWSWRLTEARPDLLPGDTVAVVTDRYTDFDPASGTSVRGWASYRLVLVGVAGDARTCTGFLLGLAGNVVQVAGGRIGALPNPAPGAIDPFTGLIDRTAPATDGGYLLRATDGAGLVAAAELSQTDGVELRRLAKGYTTGRIRDGQTVAFGIPFQAPPMIILRGGQSTEPRALWGTAAQCETLSLTGAGGGSAAPDPALPQRPEITGEVTATTLRLSAKIRQKTAPSSAGQGNSFPAGNALTAVGHTAAATVAAAPANGNVYTIHYRVELYPEGAFTGEGENVWGTVSVTVCIDSSADGGATWTERYRGTYAGGTNQLTVDPRTWVHEQVERTVAGLDGTDQFRLRILEASATKGDATVAPTFSVHGFVGGTDPAAGVTYGTSGGGGDRYATMTPDADDVLTYEALAVT